MKVLVTGSAGLLGHDVWKLFERKHDLVGLGRTQAAWVDASRFHTCDLTNAAHTYALVTKENPEVVVHCAAYNNVDAAESDPDTAYKGNALAVRNLALACQRCNSYRYNFTTALDPETQTMVPLFNPRTQRWAEHFVWTADGLSIVKGAQIAGMQPAPRKVSALACGLCQ